MKDEDTLKFLTPEQSLKNMIDNDTRNIIEMKERKGFKTQTVVIANCAKRLFDARKIAPSLVPDAERNLEWALEGW